MNKIKTIVILLASLIPMFSIAQNTILKGSVYDKESNEALLGATVIIKGTKNGTATDKNGHFQLSLDLSKTKILFVSYLGYKTQEIEVNKEKTAIKVFMERSFIPGEEVVISASRISEKLLKSPITVQKLSANEIAIPASSNYFVGMDNLMGIDIIQNNFGFGSFNTRGFNATAPFRVVTFMDGMDNASTGLNFSPGSSFGLADLDIESIEIISGPASALYGPNAMQGVLSMSSKNPFDYQGVSAMVKGGNQSYMEGQLRIAETFLNNKLGVKLVASYFEADDWLADDPVANTYRVMPATVDFSPLLANPNYADFNNYLASNPSARPTSIMLPGYLETDISNNDSKALKLLGSVHYKITDDIELSYLIKRNTTTGVFQGNNRAMIKNFKFTQQKVSLKGKNFEFMAYQSVDDANESYDLGLTGINLSYAGLGNVVPVYFDAFVNEVKNLTNNYTDPFDYATMMAVAQSAASAVSADKWLQPGTETFDRAFEEIIANPDRPTGSRYPSYSVMNHIAANYQFDIDFMDILVGGTYRHWNPDTKGKVFSDTSGVDISFYEVAAFADINKVILNDKLKLNASFRLDKNENFDAQFSPRLAAIFSQGNHHLRLSAQSAFRSPTLNDQYFLLNVGPLIVRGNITGYDNMYTYPSVLAFRASQDPSVLETIVLDPITPERLNSVEFGYKTSFNGKFYTDFHAYYNVYKNFIGSTYAVEPHTGNAGEQSGVNDLMTGQFQAYSIPVNSVSDVVTYGAGISLSYYVGNGIMAYVNYTYAKFDSSTVEDGFVPGFNTPENKFNIGLKGRKVYKGLGFNINYKYADAYWWESAFADGYVPSFTTLDIQLNYELSKYNTRVNIGGTNILNKEYFRAYGSPGIGAFYYASIVYELNNLF
jgi:iron complex outermembrane receptor protein